MEVVAGVDCHRDTHSIVFLDAVGRVLEELNIAVSSEGYRQALKIAGEFDEVHWGLESTGCYWSASAKVILEAGAIVYEVAGAFTKRHRKRASETVSRTSSMPRRLPRQCYVSETVCTSSVRVNVGGNRRLNRLLHVLALSQIRRDDHPGRAYYDRKRREGKTHRGAIRSLKRQLCTVVYYRLRTCQLHDEQGSDVERAA